MGRVSARGRQSTPPPQREYRASIGARHPIRYSQELATFYADLGRRWAAILPELEDDERQLVGAPRRRSVVYKNAHQVGVTVLEGRLADLYARRQRLRCTSSDIGRFLTMVDDGLARLEEPEGGLSLTLTGVERVGDRANRFALVTAPFEDLHYGHPDRDVLGYLADEHKTVIAGVGTVFPGFSYPYVNYRAKLTVGRISNGTSRQDADRCAQALQALQALTPLTVTLGDVAIFANQRLGRG